MFKEVIDFVDSVATVVTELKYHSPNEFDEITDYPAFVLENLYEKSFERQSQSHQYYLTKLKLHFYFFSKYDPADSDGDATFDLIADKIFVAMTNYATLGYKMINILNVSKRFWMIGAEKCRGVDGEIEFIRTESWT